MNQSEKKDTNKMENKTLHLSGKKKCLIYFSYCYRNQAGPYEALLPRIDSHTCLPPVENLNKCNQRSEKMKKGKESSKTN